jgi:hypothetical protein
MSKMGSQWERHRDFVAVLLLSESSSQASAKPAPIPVTPRRSERVSSFVTPSNKAEAGDTEASDTSDEESSEEEVDERSSVEEEDNDEDEEGDDGEKVVPQSAHEQASRPFTPRS